MSSPSSPPRSGFATTRWTLVCAAAHGGDAGAVSALGELFQTYWSPLYRYARRKGKSPADAEDLVQGFFAHLIESGGLRSTDPARGRFRSFLLAGFSHWMINDWKHATRKKRGGHALELSIDRENAETGLRLEPADELGPDRLFDRDWALALLAKVLRDLETICRAEGGETQFSLLKSSLASDSGRIPYAELGPVLGLSEGAARVAVHRLRKRYRALLNEEIARTLAPSSAIEEELRALFAALAG